MKKPFVQIYEIQEPREAEALIEMGVDRIGSVVLARDCLKSPSLRDTVRLCRGAAAQSSLIVLVQDEDDLLRALEYYEPDFVHFCEDIPLAANRAAERNEILDRMIVRQNRIRKEFPSFLITRTVPVPPAGDYDHETVQRVILEIAEKLAPGSDNLMTDTVRGYGQKQAEQPVSGYVGITGDVCDWGLARSLVENCAKPVILAGGISPENVREAVSSVCPAGVDSCTQTNARDRQGKPIRFRKDPERVRRLIDELSGV